MTDIGPAALRPDGFAECGGPPLDPVPAAMARDAGQQ
jgi:hypothetical protein